MNFILYSEIHNLFEQGDEGFWIVNKEVRDWFDENNINVVERCATYNNTYHSFGLDFDNEEDAVAFKLRWM